MLLREKGAKKDAEPVSMGWDEAQAGVAAGTHVPANDEPQDEADDKPIEPEKPEKKIGAKSAS